MIAVDTSRSMAAKDVSPTRLDAAKKSIRDFLAKAPMRIASGVSFASTARVVAPPSRDRTLVDEALDQLRVGQGTALGDAIARAVEVGQGAGQTDPADKPTPTTVLLISDGKEDGGTISAQQASQTARNRGVHVYTVALGTEDGVVEVPLQGGYTPASRCQQTRPRCGRSRRPRAAGSSRCPRPISSSRSTPISRRRSARRRSGAR